MSHPIESLKLDSSPKEFSSEAVWNLVKDRIGEHLKVFKWITIAIGSIVSCLVAALVALLSVQEIRDFVVKRWIVDVDQKINRFMDDHRAQLFALETQIDNYMNKVVAYSYSASFQLSGNSGPKYYILPFYNTNKDSGKLICDATYSSSKIKNKVLLQVNNRRTVFGEISPDISSNSGHGDYLLPKENSQLFADTTEPKSDQTIAFTVDRTTPFDGTIYVRCTILIIGPAKLAEQVQ